ncbi:ABC transporter permease [uncultured Tateyamaria sp.]|uniref:ABC transporter permease n=1 Tax=uncultured Tateyamaria sp. TaxID=455651 RepID=UPI0026083B5A|nr:ABC transporter permease [uncultured Tateyamaria sp.]
MRKLFQGWSGDRIELTAMVAFLALSVLCFAGIAPNFLSVGIFRSMAFQLPELGLLTLAMFIPIIAGGLNLAVTFTANICGLAAAFIVQKFLLENGGLALPIALIVAVLTGLVIGMLVGAMVAYVGAHPILVTLGAMIFLRGLGELLTRGGDISGMPPVFEIIGHGTLFGVPIPMWIFLAAVAVCFYIMQFTKLGFSIHMVGSNPKATLFSGIDVNRVLVWVYGLSGALSGLAGFLMLARFNSVRVGHGESYLLITILACFLAGANPFGGFGRVLPLAVGLISLQVIASGMNLMGASQHLATAAWGGFLILVMILRAPFQSKT